MNRISRSMGQRRVELRRLWWAAPTAAIAAALANSVVYAVAEAAGALPNDVMVPTAAGEGPLGIGEVLFGSIVPLIGAAVVLAIAATFARRPLRAFWSIALVALVLSLGAPFSIPGAPAGMIAVLLSMHLVSAGVGLPVLTKLARPTTDAVVQSEEQIRQDRAA